jgi:hypothetical protein
MDAFDFDNVTAQINVDYCVHCNNLAYTVT